MFKVGDRVRAIAGLPRGHIGKVVEVGDGCALYNVEFNDWTYFGGDSKWHMHPNALELVSRADQGGWIEWHGGDCPVAPDTMVEVRLRDGNIHTNHAKGFGICWHDDKTSQDITAYRIASAFDPDWPHGHVTRDGRKARVICTDAKGDYPIVALFDCGGHEDAETFTKNGQHMASHKSEHDLFNAPAPTPIRLKVGQVVEDEAGRRGLVSDLDCGLFGVDWVGGDYTSQFEHGGPYYDDGQRITRIVLEPGAEPDA